MLSREDAYVRIRPLCEPLFDLNLITRSGFGPLFNTRVFPNRMAAKFAALATVANWGVERQNPPATICISERGRHHSSRARLFALESAAHNACSCLPGRQTIVRYCF
jgi:hypothetical protein